MSACALALAVAHSCLVAVFSSRHGDFQGDDIVGMYQARELPFWKYLTTPIDVHFVPLHRLVTLVLARSAPANFGAAVAVLLAFHLLAMLLLYRTLEFLRPSSLNAVLASWYATHVYIGVLFTWWTSGLHRLPYVFLLAASLHAYVKHRWRPRPATFITVVACFVAAIGFFEKALLIPVVLAGVEVCLFGESSVRTRRAVAWLLGTLGIVAVAYVAVWRHAVGPQWASIGGGASFLTTYLKLSWVVLGASAVAQVHRGGTMLLALLGVLMVATTVRRREVLVVWIAGAVVVSTSLIITGVSEPRSGLWGFLLPYAHRYYPDVMFVLVLFVGLACQRAMSLGIERAARPFGLPAPRTVVAWAALSAVLCVAVMSYRAADGDMNFLYRQQSEVRAYMRNLASDLEPLRRRRTPPSFVNGQVPHFVNPMGGWTAQHSVFVEALGVKARIVPKGRLAYRILPTGRIVFGKQ